MIQPWAEWPLCPCGCGAEGLKLQSRFDQHLVGCVCRVCTGRRSRKKGQHGQAKMHRRLGGEGFTPSNEESARPYTIEVSVMPESKTGEQIPASWDKFVGTDWFRKALSQSERAVPTGSSVLPALVLRGDFCIVDLRGRASHLKVSA